MKILITEDGYMEQSSDLPVVGRSYILEDATTGSSAQNKAAHALIQEYFKSGCYSDEVDTWLELRNKLKIRLGEGFEAFVYVDIKKSYRLQDAKNYKDIPLHVRSLPERNLLIRGRLKSWADYTMKQRKNFIDNLIAEMDTAKVQTKKYYEIREGMETK